MKCIGQKFAYPYFTLGSYMICTLLLAYGMEYSVETVSGVWTA
jgi:hypothetical protein